MAITWIKLHESIKVGYPQSRQFNLYYEHN